MSRSHVKLLLAVCFWEAAFSSALFSEYLVSWAKGDWLRTVAVEVRAACRDPGTQWMVFLCAGIYFVTFTLLAGRSGGNRSTINPHLTPPGSGTLNPPPAPPRRGADKQAHARSSPPGRGQEWVAFCRVNNPDLWLCGLLAITALTYALDYQKASASTQALVLLAGAAFGKGVLVWALWAGKVNPSELERRAPPRHVDRPAQEPGQAEAVLGAPIWIQTRMKLVIAILVLILACAALWQPMMAMEYQYRGQRRWSGAWNNPNVYGMLMAVGLVLAIGLLVQSPKFKVQSGRLRWLSILWFAGVAGLCGFGLLKSYSRGAWVGAVIGLAYLLWQSSKAESRKQKAEIAGDCATRITHHAPRPSRFRFPLLRPLFVILASFLVLSFWQFRHTEWPPVRRVFSMANINDFSWRNRVTAWQGAVRMMADRPFAGFGWGNAQQAYDKDYRAPRLTETAAIQMNDFLMLGISTGVPALLCFTMYLALSFRTRFGVPPSGGLAAKPRERGTPNIETCAESPSSILHPLSSLSASCLGGAGALLVGFWFDGGLFNLPTAAMFWTLMELGRLDAPLLGGVGGGFASEAAAPESPVKRNEFRAPIRKLTRTEIGVRWVAGILASVALVWTAFHLVTPRLAVNERTLAIARKYLVQPKQTSDFDFLAANLVWRGKRLRYLLEHVELANYNRELIGWKLDDAICRDFVLSPEIDPAFDGEMNWRRPLWEHFFPRIRKETEPQAAAEIVIKELSQSVTLASNPLGHADLKTMWKRGAADAAGFEAVYVAVLRSVGIPARLTGSHQTELFTGAEWKLAPRPLP